MNTLKISVIIPVYNVEPYLRRCVDSVLAQTYNNIEVILVDDGSSDGCPAICDEYARRDSRITVIHKINGGISSARNAALDSALTGDFIAFIDSDDWISLDAYEYCVKWLTYYKADVLQFDYSLANDTKAFKRNPAREEFVILEGKEILQNFLTTSTITGSYSACRCLFSKAVIGDIRFREGKINEDIDWKYKVLSQSKRMITSNQVMYYYYQSGNSISSGGLRMRDFQLREAAELLRDLTANENYGMIRKLGEVKAARTAFSLLSKIAYFGIEDSRIDKKQVVKVLTTEHRKNLFKLLDSPIPFNRKILSIMFAINYKMSELAIHVIKKFYYV